MAKSAKLVSKHTFSILLFILGRFSWMLRIDLSSLSKKPQLEDGVYLSNTATVIEMFELENSSIWYGAVLRGDINYI